MPESGLTGEQLKVNAPRFLRSGTLEWVVVLPDGQLPEDYALISYAGETHLFEVTPTEGARVVKVLPPGDVSSTWVRAATQAPEAAVRFISGDALIKEAPALTGAVGLVTFTQGAPGELTWLGAAPDGPTNLMFIARTAGALSTRLVGQGIWDEKQGGLKVKENALNGAHFVVADGSLDVRLDDYVVGVVGGQESAVPGFVFRPAKLDAELLKGQERRIRQAALELGIDAISWKDDRGFHLLGVDLYDDRLSQGEGITPGVLGVVMTFEDQSGVFRGAQALDAIRRGHALRAVHALDGVKMTVGGSRIAATLRTEELLGDAHRAQWMYHALTQSRKKLEAPEFIYLSRAYLLAGAPYDALVMAERARQAFSDWRGQGQALGLARSLQLIGLAHHMNGETDSALEHLEQSVTMYKQGNDQVAGAEVENMASAIARRAKMRDRALREGKRARSRFYHGNDIFSCGQTELELVDMYLEYDLKEEAQSTARYGLLRMQELKTEVGINRARIVEAVIKQARTPGSVTVQELREFHTRAIAQRDGWGEMAATSALVLLGGDLESDELVTFGNALVRGRAQFGVDVLGVRVERALASACAQGFGSDVPKTTAMCEEVMKGYAPGDGLVLTWVAQGYGNILRGLDEEVATSTARLASLLTDELIKKSPAVAAQVQLYLSAASSDEATRLRYMEEGIVNLRRLDVSQRALTMYALALELEQRGQRQFKQPLLKDAAESAHAQGQRAMAVTAGLAHVRALREANLLEEALSAAQLTQGRLTDEDRQSKAHLAMERALIGAMRGTTSSSTSDWANAFDTTEKLDALEALEVLLAALEVSLSQAKGVQSLELEQRIKARESGMTSTLVSSLEGKRVLAHAELLRAEQFERDARLAEALKLAASASATLADDPEPEAVWVRARSLAMLARHAYSVTQTEETEQRLEELWARQSERLAAGRFSAGDYRAPVAVARALSEIRYLRGDADGAQAVFAELMVAGFSPTTDMASVACERGLLLVVSGDLTRGKAELERCMNMKPTGEIAYRAKMMRALLEETPSARRQGMMRLLDSQSARERARRTMLLDLNELKALSASQSASEKKQYARYTSAKRGEILASEGDALVQLLLAHGKIEEARGVLEELKPLLYELGAEYPVDYVRLKTDVLYHDLAVVEAQFYLERASVELPQGLEPARQIALDMMRAKLALGLGQWTLARTLLSDASTLARANGEKGLLLKINALAVMFELQL